MDLKTGVTMAVMIAAASAGTLVLTSAPIYYCQASDTVIQCDHLSAQNAVGVSTRCYLTSASTPYKSCTLGWQIISRSQVPSSTTPDTSVIVVQDGKDWACADSVSNANCTFGGRAPNTYGNIIGYSLANFTVTRG